MVAVCERVSVCWGWVCMWVCESVVEYACESECEVVTSECSPQPTQMYSSCGLVIEKQMDLCHYGLLTWSHEIMMALSKHLFAHAHYMNSPLHSSSLALVSLMWRWHVDYERMHAGREDEDSCVWSLVFYWNRVYLVLALLEGGITVPLDETLFSKKRPDWPPSEDTLFRFNWLWLVFFFFARFVVE